MSGDNGSWEDTDAARLLSCRRQQKLTFFKTASAPIDKAVTKRRLTSILVPASIAAACARPGSEKPAVESLAS